MRETNFSRERRAQSRLLTTADVAKELGLSTRGVRWLASQGELPFEPTRSGQLIFHLADVRRCVLTRANGRSRPRADVLRAVHLRMVKAGIDPVQLSFLKGVGLRIVARGERALPDREVKAARSFENRRESESASYVNRSAAAGRGR